MTASEKTDLLQDTMLIGIGASPGIAIGETYMVNRARMSAVERTIDEESVDQQIAAFMAAVNLSKKQLEEVKQSVTDRDLSEHIYIIDTHLMILEDQMLLDETRKLIREEKINAEGALKRTLDKFRKVFETIDDEYLRERRSDMDFVGERLLRNLLGEHQQSLKDIDRKVVVIAHDLSPADTMQMDKSKIVGFVTDVGGRTSHTAILARSMGIPAVVGLENVTSFVPGGTPVIIDGTAGIMILHPSEDLFKEYLRKKQIFEYQERELLNYRDLPAITLDGHRVALRGNVEISEEVPLALQQGAEGIGLYRSEFLYMNRLVPPSEVEQVEAYRDIVEQMKPQVVTIRTLDVGGDKFVPEINLSDESNPAMGLRAIRFSLKERRLFKTQLRAILRTSAFGKVRIMFPMISGVAEIRTCKSCLEEAKAELVAEGVPFDEHILVGIMIETPSAALIAHLLAREVDFFSIGTNDLIQYCLAVDRSNEHVAYLYEPLHPAVLEGIRMICAAAKAADIEIGMCGEMAGEPMYALVLLGFGFTELSMNAPGIPRVKRILRQVRRDDGEKLLHNLMKLSTASEVKQHLEEVMTRRFPDLFEQKAF
ncbi:phosphoenolpyruvate--protein phosphotransferase [Desulfuromonas sp. KJ2020]|uniref:phosphoenolpyruvate--protein phosphotransferase n=1 Tax=Desulfuromonas sp. KJ2020 TaxID=2919173 RepID=UPI0020A6E017|nr:phosphoenolpyruvate--protein phosphotransferase [Desulfuromonas sp. KJ2020]MCP3178072.1 phosphoenolpyruvate--protein phosphotransferase [Desulfuromonas sp. KJ2020]